MLLMHKQEPCSIEQLRRWLSYDSDTGVFIWRVSLNNTIAVGQLAGTLKSNGYIYISLNDRKCLAHRLAWFYVYGEWPQHILDHINGKRADNRLANLRASNHTLNRANSKTRRKGLKGIRKNGNRWSAQIEEKGVVYHQGTFDTPEEAHEAYKKATARVFGNFARFE